MLIKVASLLQQLVVHKIRPAASIRLDDINGYVMIRLDDILPYTHVKNTSSIRLAIRAIDFAMHRGKSRPRATSPALALFMSARFSLVEQHGTPRFKVAVGTDVFYGFSASEAWQPLKNTGKDLFFTHNITQFVADCHESSRVSDTGR
jgi:hypothetical protein